MYILVKVLRDLFVCSSSSEDECTIIDDDDDDTVSHVPSIKQNSTVANVKRSRLEVSSRNSQSSSGTGRSGHKMGVNFGSDSSDEAEFDHSVPQRKRLR